MAVCSLLACLPCLASPGSGSGGCVFTTTTTTTTWRKRRASCMCYSTGSERSCTEFVRQSEKAREGEGPRPGSATPIRENAVECWIPPTPGFVFLTKKEISREFVGYAVRGNIASHRRTVTPSLASSSPSSSSSPPRSKKSPARASPGSTPSTPSPHHHPRPRKDVHTGQPLLDRASGRRRCVVNFLLVA